MLPRMADRATPHTLGQSENISPAPGDRVEPAAPFLSHLSRSDPRRVDTLRHLACCPGRPVPIPHAPEPRGNPRAPAVRSTLRLALSAHLHRHGWGAAREKPTPLPPRQTTSTGRSPAKATSVTAPPSTSSSTFPGACARRSVINAPRRPSFVSMMNNGGVAAGAAGIGRGGSACLILGFGVGGAAGAIGAGCSGSPLLSSATGGISLTHPNSPP